MNFARPRQKLAKYKVSRRRGHSQDVAASVSKKPSYSDPALNQKCSEFEVNNWTISEFIINELVPVVGHHPFPLTELNLMVGAMTWFKPTHLFEWGTHIGKSARVFSEVAEHFNLKTHIYSVDLPDNIEHTEHPHEQRGMLVRDRPNVTLIQGDGLKDSLAIIKKLPTSSKILFFIDGDHSYKSVKYELETLIGKVPNAVFLLHDSFYQSEASKYNIGPFKAMSEALARQKDKYKIVSANTGLPGMSLIYRA